MTFVLAWHFPQRENDWNREPEVKGQLLRNDYAHALRERLGRWLGTPRRTSSGFSRGTRTFHDALFTSTLPAHVLDAASSQMSILRTNTCLLLEGERFFGFEGCGDEAGCCPMNCTHVWNYAQALAFLFPSLERSMRETDFLANTRPDGSMAFRTLLPVGRGLWSFKPAADGQMGSVLKLYREWQISGDEAFLRRLWPQAKRALEFAWTSWDADRDGVMEGEQHNTYDIEFYGPNSDDGYPLSRSARRPRRAWPRPWATARRPGPYGSLFERGRAEARGALERRVLRPTGAQRRRGDPSLERQSHRGVARARGGGRPGPLPVRRRLPLRPAPGRMVRLGGRARSPAARRTRTRHPGRDLPPQLQARFLRAPERPAPLCPRADEKGLLLCSWPRGGRPALPFVYADEVWTGIEYQVAAHLIYSGQVAEGLAIVKGVRDRHDGRRRNPWNEVECGSHYARALSSWSLVLALSGFSFSAPEGRIGFAPRVNARDFRCFFSTGGGWGTFEQRVAETRAFDARLDVRYGEIRLRRLELRNEAGWKQAVAASVSGPDGRSARASVRLEGETLRIDLGRELAVREGQGLALALRPA